MSKRLNIIGQKFGKLTVIKFIYIKNNLTYWKCYCDCGKYHTVIGRSLISGHTKSCGCSFSEINITHGMGRTKFYHRWAKMKDRCLNKKDKRYKDYGGRKIQICDRWIKFENFRNDMYESYLKHVEQFGEKNTSIERENNNGNYCPENCSWQTYKKQGNNKRNNHLLTLNGQILTISEWCDKLDLPYSTIRNRINSLHWSPEKALTVPIRKLTKSS